MVGRLVADSRHDGIDWYRATDDERDHRHPEQERDHQDQATNCIEDHAEDLNETIKAGRRPIVIRPPTFKLGAKLLDQLDAAHVDEPDRIRLNRLDDVRPDGDLVVHPE